MAIWEDKLIMVFQKNVYMYIFVTKITYLANGWSGFALRMVSNGAGDQSCELMIESCYLK